MAKDMVFKIEGLDKLEKKLKDNIKLDDIKRIVRQNGMELNEKMIKNADFNKGYQTGTTKRSIRLSIKNSGLEAVSEPMTEYAPYLEYGTRFMDAQPFVKPAFETQKVKFKRDMDKITR